MTTDPRRRQAQWERGVSKRFVFRQVCRRDLQTCLDDGEIRAKNHPMPQRVHQTSYANIVETRGTAIFTLPHGGVVNDYVPFYFSPLTSFTYTISQGNVDLRCPDNNVLGKAHDDERIFFVCEVDAFAGSGLDYCFSNLALNTAAPMPSLDADLSNLHQHVAWHVFDDPPYKAPIPEIGYDGVCQFFASRPIPQKYLIRSKQRMAEFCVKSAVPLSMVTCVVTRSFPMQQTLETIMHSSNWNIPVFAKPGCYFT